MLELNLDFDTVCHLTREEVRGYIQRLKDPKVKVYTQSVKGKEQEDEDRRRRERYRQPY